MRPTGWFLTFALFIATIAHAAEAPSVPPRVAELLQEAKAHVKQRRLDDAIRSSEQAVEAHRSIVGNDDPELSRTLSRHASHLTGGGRREDALAIRREILRIASKAYGEGHFKVRSARLDLAVAEAVNAFTAEEYADFLDNLARFNQAFESLEQEHDQEACRVVRELLPYFSDKCGPACDHSRSIRTVPP